MLIRTRPGLFPSTCVQIFHSLTIILLDTVYSELPNALRKKARNILHMYATVASQSRSLALGLFLVGRAQLARKAGPIGYIM
jgi:hypothetical protein